MLAKPSFSKIKVYIFRILKQPKVKLLRLQLDHSFVRFRKEFNSMRIKQSTQSPIIIVFANYGYIDIVLNWIKAIEVLGINNHLIISMDVRLHRKLIEKSINTILFEVDTNLNLIWEARVKVCRFLVENNYDFIHSDADAIWLNNPIEEYFGSNSNKELDLIMSQGTIYPRECFKEWGLVLCCGLFFVRSNEKTIQLLREIEDDTKRTGDDQKSLNMILKGKNLTWTLETLHQINFQLSGKPYEINISDQMIQSECDGIKVGLLPFRKFPRLAVYQKDPYVVHPLTPKKGLSKRQEFEELGLWFLK